MYGTICMGTCSLCGGRVSIPRVFMGIITRVPTCESCHATAGASHGPVIPMTPAQKPIRITVGDKIPPDVYVISGENLNRPIWAAKS